MALFTKQDDSSFITSVNYKKSNENANDRDND